MLSFLRQIGLVIVLPTLYAGAMLFAVPIIIAEIPPPYTLPVGLLLTLGGGAVLYWLVIRYC